MFYNEFVNLLIERDNNESTKFDQLICDFNRVLEEWRHIKLQNIQYQNELNNSNSLIDNFKNELDRADSNKCHELDKKASRLQDELNDVHKSNGKLVQDLHDANKMLQEKERSFQSLNSKYTEVDREMKTLSGMVQSFKNKILDLEEIKRHLLDEQNASNLQIKSLETKLNSSKDENIKLIMKIQSLQKQIEEYENTKFDLNFRMEKEKAKLILADAANSVLDVDDSSIDFGDVCNVIPTKPVVTLTNDIDGDLSCVKFSPSGFSFASGGQDRKVRIWSFYNGKSEFKSMFVGCNAGILSIDFDPTENLILGSSNDFGCRIWNISDCRVKTNLTGHSDKVVSAKFMGTDSKVVSASSDRTLKIWDLNKRQCLKTIVAMSACHDVVFNTSFGLTISGHCDKKIRLWDQRGELNTDQIVLPGKVTGLDISKDSYYLLACTRDDVLRVIDLRMNDVIEVFQGEGFQTGFDYQRPCFSANSRYVCVGGSDGNVYIWDRQNRQLECKLSGHSKIVVCVNWSPQGDHVISCERSKKAIVWGA